MMNHYYLKDGVTVPVQVWSDDGELDQAALVEWALWYEHADRRIALTRVGLFAEVSTVFLGLDHGFGGPPLLFETVVFMGGHAGELDRYSTLDEARAGHDQMVAWVRACRWWQTLVPGWAWALWERFA